MVRSYAYALSGWTYPAGGQTAWGCWPSGANCRYYTGDMVPAPKLRDTQARTLLRKVQVAAGTPAEQAVELVLDSLMKHPNVAPFVAKRLGYLPAPCPTTKILENLYYPSPQSIAQAAYHLVRGEGAPAWQPGKVASNEVAEFRGPF